MFFIRPHEVKHFWLREALTFHRMTTAAPRRGRELSGFVSDDCGSALNPLTLQGNLGEVDIFLHISGSHAIFSINRKLYQRQFPYQAQTRARPPSDSEMAPQPIEKARFGLGNGRRPLSLIPSGTCSGIIEEGRGHGVRSAQGARGATPVGQFVNSIAELRRPAASALWPTWISNRPGSRTRSRLWPTNERSSTGSRHFTSLRSPAARAAFCTPLSSNSGRATLATGSRTNRNSVASPSTWLWLWTVERYLDRVASPHTGRHAAKIEQRKAAV